MVDRSAIQKHMEVRASDGTVVGRVDDVDGDRIKLTKHDSPDGQHHYVDISQVSRVDEHVHLSTTRDAIFGATAAGTTGVGTGEGPLPPTLNRQVEGATPRGNYYLPWIVGAIGLILLLLLLSRCFHTDRSDVVATAPLPAETVTTNTTTTREAANQTIDLPSGITVNSRDSLLNYNLARYLASDEATPKTFTFDKLNFDTGSAAIRDADRPNLQVLAQILTAYPSAKVRLVGYTDARGTAPANDQLGAQRAQAVVDALGALAVDKGQLSTGTGGESNPADTNATSGGRFENRRTELVVTAK